MYIFAHINRKYDRTHLETLIEHKRAVVCYYRSFLSIPHIQTCIDRMIPESEKEIVLHLMEQAILFHDEGKKSPILQRKMRFGDSGGKDSRHSSLSALMYMDKMKNYIKAFVKENQHLDCKRLIAIMELFANNIKGHHTSINSIYKKKGIADVPLFYNELDEYDTNIRCETDELKALVSDSFFVLANEKMKLLEKSYFYLGKLHYSLLINADFLATSDFFNCITTTKQQAQEKLNEMLLTEEQVVHAITVYESSELLMVIRSGKPTSEINRVRTDIFKSVENTFYSRPFEHIYFLTAPTAAGKTNISLHLSLQITKAQKKTKIVQVIPLNSVNEQTYMYMHSALTESALIPELINSSGYYSEQYSDTEETPEWYDTLHLHRQRLAFPFVVTSHVRFFDSLFSNKRIQDLALVQLCNSVVILDEIQAYNEHKWFEIARALNDAAEHYNITFVIMSATMVYLNEFIQKECCELLEHKRTYLTHPVFKERVTFDLTHLTSTHSLDDLVHVIQKVKKPNTRLLIEVETKKKAYSLYRKIKAAYSGNVMILTRDENTFAQKIIIDALKREKDGEFVLNDLILIATSVVEYGMDIDFDIGIQQVTTLDSIEQFAGRINRSNKRSGVLYLVDLDGATRTHLLKSSKYRLDPRFTIYKSKDNENEVRVLRTKEIDVVYSEIIRRTAIERHSKLEKIYENKDYTALMEVMKLIESNNYQRVFFIPYKTDTMDGYRVYEEYLALIRNQELYYGEKKIKILQHRNAMEPFLFKVDRPRAASLGLDWTTRGTSEADMFIYDEREDLLEDVPILDRSYKRLKIIE